MIASLATVINEFSGLLLFFALLLMLFAVAIFLVNSYQIFAQGEEQAAAEEEKSASGVSGPGLDGGQRQQPAANAERAPANDSERRPLSYYYQNSPELAAKQGSGNQDLWPLFGAALIVAGSALAAAVYWRQRQSR